MILPKGTSHELKGVLENIVRAIEIFEALHEIGPERVRDLLKESAGGSNYVADFVADRLLKMENS